jgi:hypothetical protein
VGDADVRKGKGTSVDPKRYIFPSAIPRTLRNGGAARARTRTTTARVLRTLPRASSTPARVMVRDEYKRRSRSETRGCCASLGFLLFEIVALVAALVAIGSAYWLGASVASASLSLGRRPLLRSLSPRVVRPRAPLPASLIARAPSRRRSRDDRRGRGPPARLARRPVGSLRAREPGTERAARRAEAAGRGRADVRSRAERSARRRRRRPPAGGDRRRRRR